MVVNAYLTVFIIRALKPGRGRHSQGTPGSTLVVDAFCGICMHGPLWTATAALPNRRRLQLGLSRNACTRCACQQVHIWQLHQPCTNPTCKPDTLAWSTDPPASCTYEHVRLPRPVARRAAAALVQRLAQRQRDAKGQRVQVGQRPAAPHQLQHHPLRPALQQTPELHKAAGF
jgi:hypothetical protein